MTEKNNLDIMLLEESQECNAFFTLLLGEKKYNFKSYNCLEDFYDDYYFNGKRADIYVLSYNLGLDVLGISNDIHRIEPNKKTFYVTTYPEELMVKKCMDNGYILPDKHIMKPFNIDNFFNIMDEHIQNGRNKEYKSSRN